MVHAKSASSLKRSPAWGCPLFAITDHGNLFGAVSFHDTARTHGIKPIIGCEVYVAPGGHKNRDVNDKHCNHLTLLSENNEGYRNPIQLVSTSFLDGFYYKPRVDHELLAKYSKGLIALSGCMSGEVAEALLADNHELARERAYSLRDIFGENNFFLEVQDHGLDAQVRLNRGLVQLSRETGISLVTTNDCHYLTRADARAHEILLCLQTGTTMSDPKRMRFATDQFYVKSADEMAQVFRELPNALRRTLAIAERCNVSINRNRQSLSRISCSRGTQHQQLLREGCPRRLRVSCADARTAR